MKGRTRWTRGDGGGFLVRRRSTGCGLASRPQLRVQTELSQYSLDLLALLFDKSCRNLSRGHFQRYCRKPRLRPLYHHRVLHSVARRTGDPTTTSTNAHSTRQLVYVFLRPTKPLYPLLACPPTFPLKRREHPFHPFVDAPENRLLL